MGYHFGQLLLHVCGTHSNDYVEMGLHHLATIYLFSGSYMLNCWECGAVISFLHDLSDVTSMIVKLSNNTYYTKFCVGVFVVHCFIWGYVRNYVFASIIYQLSYIVPFTENVILNPIFLFLLSCLCMLHYYWMYMFLSLIYKYAREGEADDIQNKIEV